MYCGVSWRVCNRRLTVFWRHTFTGLEKQWHPGKQCLNRGTVWWGGEQFVWYSDKPLRTDWLVHCVHTIVLITVDLHLHCCDWSLALCTVFLHRLPVSQSGNHCEWNAWWGQHSAQSLRFAMTAKLCSVCWHLFESDFMKQALLCRIWLSVMPLSPAPVPKTDPNAIWSAVCSLFIFRLSRVLVVRFCGVVFHGGNYRWEDKILWIKWNIWLLLFYKFAQSWH